MRKSRNSNNDLHTILTTFLILSAIILSAVAILFGGLFNHLSISPPPSSNTTIEQETNYGPSSSTDVSFENNSNPELTDTSTSKETDSTVNHIETTEENIDSSEITTEENFTESMESESTQVVPIGTVYLTFDDGPSTKTTSQILDILKEKDVKATFFVLDYSYGSEKEALVIREFEEGHTVALHGISHDYSKIYSSLETLIKNFTDLQEKVKTSTGYTSKIIRFPGGSSNTVSKKYRAGIMTEAVEYFSNSEFIYFDWSVDSRDAGGVSSSEELYSNVINGLKPGKTNIVLMHDSVNKEYTIDALERIIDFCISEGYELKAITEDTPQVTHHVSN